MGGMYGCKKIEKEGKNVVIRTIDRNVSKNVILFDMNSN